MNNFIETFDTAHIFRMTDDTGMFQHALYSVPNLLEGYTTDDNARALIMAVMLYEGGERLLVAEYDDKLAAIKKVTRLEKRKQRRTKSADYY